MARVQDTKPRESARRRPGARHSAVQSEATATGYSKADFLRDFGHDADYHAKCDRTTAALRALAAGNPWPRAGRNDCGWWWCEKDDLSARELASLREALNTLRQAGVNPNDPWVRKYGNFYRMHGALPDIKAAARDQVYRDVAALEKAQELIAGLSRHSSNTSTIRDLLKDEIDLCKGSTAAVPANPKKRGPRADAGTRGVLLNYQRTAPWQPQVIEACLILIGARRGSARESRVLREMMK